ncbi:MAG: hypothetical protein AB7E73_08015 [Burkholderiales bacterium]
MIRLKRDRAAIPAKYRGAKFLDLMTRLLDGYYEFDHEVPFNREKSRFQQWKQAKLTLIAESHGKCAYCESPTSIVAHGDVEHFRPKDIYWWLAFSYDNYTYSCQLCNQKFKGANFPVAGTTVKTPVKLPSLRPSDSKVAELAAKLCPDPAQDNDAKLLAYFKSEKAHLPHPYLDDPEALFAWEADDINREIHLISQGSGVAARRALKAAEEFLGLNREELRRARYVQYRLIEGFVFTLQESSQANIRDRAKGMLREAVLPGQPYAGMSRYFLRQWNILE